LALSRRSAKTDDRRHNGASTLATEKLLDSPEFPCLLFAESSFNTL